MCVGGLLDQKERDAAAGGICCEQFLDVLRPVGCGDGNAGHDPGLMPLLPEAGDQVSTGETDACSNGIISLYSIRSGPWTEESVGRMCLTAF